jgi:uncharacterized membrane protein YkvI
VVLLTGACAVIQTIFEIGLWAGILAVLVALLVILLIITHKGRQKIDNNQKIEL